MTKATDAKVGDKENCATCGVEMICGLTKGSPQYPAKQQWQVDGKAHYNFDFKTKTTTCNTGIIEDPKNKATQNHAGNEIPYSPPTNTPEIIRQETGIEFEKVYGEFIPRAKEIAKTITLGQSPSDKEICISTQGIMHDYIRFFIAKNF